MILDFLGLKENKIPDNVWVDAAKNCKNVEQFNELVLTLDMYNIFELIFDIMFLASTFMSVFILIFIFTNIKKYTRILLQNIKSNISKRDKYA